jgi:hypothetical protein
MQLLVDLREGLRNFHKGYWSQNLMIRAAIADFILSPPQDTEADFEKNFRFLVSEVLPKDPVYQKETETLLKNYLDILEDYQKGRYLAAILGATRVTEESANKSLKTGEFIATVLEQMGPAERKAIQAIHSYPGTPDHIRQGMADAKVFSDPLIRWDLWKEIKKIPQELQAQIQRVGKTEGAASFWVVVNAELKAGSELARINGERSAALGVQRPFTTPKTVDGFRRLNAFVKRVESPKMREALTHIVSEAEVLASAELDPSLTKQQFRKSEELYNGLQIRIGTEDFEVESVRLLGNAHGPHFRFMNLARGPHFNDLPEKTAAEVAEKRKWAIVHVVSELSLLLSGRETDEDPHGGNIRIDPARRLMVRLDPGGIAQAKPTSRELQLLGDTLFKSLSVPGGNSTQRAMALVEAINESVHAFPESRAFLVRFEKSVLALQDAWRLLEARDLDAVFRSLSGAGLIHPEVVKGFAGTGMTQLKRLPALARLATTKTDCDALLIAVRRKTQ